MDEIIVEYLFLKSQYNEHIEEEKRKLDPYYKKVIRIILPVLNYLIFFYSIFFLDKINKVNQNLYLISVISIIMILSIYSYTTYKQYFNIPKKQYVSFNTFSKDILQNINTYNGPKEQKELYIKKQLKILQQRIIEL